MHRLNEPACTSVYQSAFPRSDANLFEWIGTMEGPAGTVSVLCSYGLFMIYNQFLVLRRNVIQNFYTLSAKLSLCTTCHQV